MFIKRIQLPSHKLKRRQFFTLPLFTNVLICLFKSCRNRKVEPINSGPCCPDELKRDDKTEKYG